MKWCPGRALNGSLSAGENLADIGGVMLGYRALQTHLKANPQDDRKVDGFTPQQRCFLAWSQMWASEDPAGTAAHERRHGSASAGRVPDDRAGSNHPAFYEAFGVRPGDKMWIDPKDRVEMW
jgi:putative endopeptidase